MPKKPHGTHSSYSHGCRCTLCIEGHRVYERNAARHRRRVKYGLEPPSTKKTDSGPAREHLMFLQSKGIGLGAVANQIGTNRATIQYIRRGKYKNITTELANKILSIPAIPREPMAFTDASPIKEMLLELQKRGITKTQVAIAIKAPDNRLVIKNKMRVWKYKKVEAACREMLRLLP